MITLLHDFGEGSVILVAILFASAYSGENLRSECPQSCNLKCQLSGICTGDCRTG